MESSTRREPEPAVDDDDIDDDDDDDIDDGDGDDNDESNDNGCTPVLYLTRCRHGRRNLRDKKDDDD
jgi:hypothetical protein